MTPIDALPDLDWSPIARREIALTGADLLRQSDFAYQIGQIAICGLVYSTLTSPPWFWFALAKGVTLRDLIDFRRTYMNLIPSGAITAVNTADRESIRFAEFYGFEETSSVRIYKDRVYKIYRRV